MANKQLTIFSIAVGDQVAECASYNAMQGRRHVIELANKISASLKLKVPRPFDGRDVETKSVEFV